MSFDLYSNEVTAHLDTLRPVTKAEPGAFDNFMSGAGRYAMQGFAKTGRAIDMLGAVGPIAQDKIMGTGTEAQDRYFKEHDDVFGSAVDYWTPKPNEVGVAGEVVGQMLGFIPQVIASPGLAIGSTQLSTGEDLVKAGVSSDKAQAVGAVQAAGLGLGIWVPILGKTLTQRVLLGGAGFNVVQGAATRGASEAILKGTPAEGQYQAFDPTQLTLDTLMGAAFGGLAHVMPGMRAEGEAWQKRLSDWGQKLKPSEVDALLTLRQAQHLNADSMPGKPVDVQDYSAHVDRMRQAIDQLAQDKPVSVEDMPAPKFEPDPARTADAEARLKEMQGQIDAVAKENGVVILPDKAPPPDQSAPQNLLPEAAGLDPLQAEAHRFAAENPDLPIVIGKNADGTDITTTPRQMLDDATAVVEQAKADASLFEIAAGCLLGAN